MLGDSEDAGARGKCRGYPWILEIGDFGPLRNRVWGTGLPAVRSEIAMPENHIGKGLAAASVRLNPPTASKSVLRRFVDGVEASDLERRERRPLQIGHAPWLHVMLRPYPHTGWGSAEKEKDMSVSYTISRLDWEVDGERSDTLYQCPLCGIAYDIKEIPIIVLEVPLGADFHRRYLVTDDCGCHDEHLRGVASDEANRGGA
jgi:hypothetical protein